MSISSLFNSASAASAYSYGSATVSSTTQAILDAVAKTTGSGTSSASAGNGVSISADAKIAAADAADKSKDFGALAVEVRTSLDNGSADLTEMSGRALSAIILNRGGTFSPGEVDAAKKALDGRSRDDFSSLMGGSATVSGLSAYNQQLVSQYDAMSAEEREARGWTPTMRSSAAAFVQGSQAMTSLFDQLDQDSSTSGTSGQSLFDMG